MNKTDFEVLFRTHYGPLCSYANRFLKDVDAAEEVVQEVMFKFWTNRNTIVIESSVKSYLFRAVRNGCLNVIKHDQIREKYRTEKESEPSPSWDSFEDQAIISELQVKIRQAVDHLPVERKKVFIMSRYDGLTYQQIATKLNISVKTVENQMGAALKTLRSELSEYLPWVILFFFDLFRLK
ncbi:MAG: RNA polymerase sigma-70 factor [Bacteroidota bacterium]